MLLVLLPSLADMARLIVPAGDATLEDEDEALILAMGEAAENASASWAREARARAAAREPLEMSDDMLHKNPLFVRSDAGRLAEGRGQVKTPRGMTASSRHSASDAIRLSTTRAWGNGEPAEWRPGPNHRRPFRCGKALADLVA